MFFEKATRPLLVIKQLTCERDDHYLFARLDWQAYAGELWQITGPNGAGKTTLLKILSGLMWYPKGELTWQLDDNDGSHWREKLGVIGHQTGLREELTATENLQWLASLHGETWQNAQQVFYALGLKGYTDVPLSHLSAGQKRRVALARLWLSDKQVWLLDEPFTAIDSQGVNLLEQQLEQLAEQGKLIIYISHHRVNPHAKQIKLGNGKAEVLT